jgi:eukaryotic-like serine/threonine-protein kinase
VSGTDLIPGSLIRGTYTVEKFIGGGAFGRVYRVNHRLLGTQALKVFRPLTAEAGLDATVEEALILSRLLNKHIIRVFEANYLEGSEELPYMTMEYLDGGTLAEFLDQHVRLDPSIALDVTKQVCDGLSVAHSAVPPIVHRDVKPQNILLESPVGNRIEIKIGDFGLAKHVDPDSRMAAAAGTLCYLAPESAWGYHTPASDVYSLGVVVYQMLTGILPYPLPPDADTATATGAREALQASRRRFALAPSRYRLGLSLGVDEVVMRALAESAGDRYSDASAMLTALEALPESAAKLSPTGW